MPNENSDAEIEEPITPDEEVAESTSEQEDSEQPQQEKPLTLDDVRALIRGELIPEINSTIQSRTAKSENRINQRIAERLAGLEANKGVLNLSEDQLKTAKATIIQEEQMNAFAPPESQASDLQRQAPSDVMQQQVEFVYSQIDAIFQTVGTPVNRNDKEWAKIEAALNDPQGSLAATQLAAADAAREKAARVAAQQKKAPGRVMSTGGERNSIPGDISNITDTAKLYEMGDEQIRKGNKR
jgi:hypothetical protein